MKKILIISMTRMGDLLQTTPLLAGLKERYPGCRISLLVNDGFSEICKQIPFIEDLYTFDLEEFIPRLVDPSFSLVDNYHYLESLITKLKGQEYDMVINLTHSRASALITSLIGAPDTRGLTIDREGYQLIKHPWMNYFFNATQNREFNQFNLVDIHCACGDIKSGGGSLHLEVSSEAEEYSKDFLVKNGVSDSDWLVGFQAGASQVDKRWPTSSFARLGDMLTTDEYNAKVILFGSPNERVLGEEIQSEMKAPVINAIGKTDLAQLAALLKRCDLLITNDTGTMHIACAVGTRVIALFLGSVRSFETGPYGEGNLILEASIPCAPCNPHVECRNPVCKRYISPEVVLKAVELSRSLPETKSCGPGRFIEQLDDSEEYKGIRMFYTAFDGDGMLDFLPLIRRPLTKRDLLNLAYRRMWVMALDSCSGNPGQNAEDLGSIRAEAEKLANRCLSLFEVKDAEKLRHAIERDVRSLKRLMKLSATGLRLCEDLIRLSQRPVKRIDLHLARKIGRRLTGIDERIGLLGLIHRGVRPLTLMFNFGKGNLEEDQLFPLALRTSRLYRLLHRESLIMHRLITTSLRNLVRQRKQRMNIWQRNIDLLKAREPQLAEILFELKDSEIEENVRILDCRNGEKTCRLKGEDGTWITFHSTCDPRGEAEKIIRSSSLTDFQIPVIVGLGLGYTLFGLLKSLRKDRPVIVVEKSPELFRTALSLFDFRDVLSRPNIHLIVGEACDRAIHRIGKLQLKYSLRDLKVIRHAPSIRAFPRFYEPVLKRVGRLSTSSLKRQVAYPKFHGERFSILFFDSGYFLLRECIQAIKRLGHRVDLVPVLSGPFKSDEEDGRNFIEVLISKIVKVKPDFIFTVNHLGFDEDGRLTELLTSLEIPFVSWFVDSPSYILQNYESNLSPFAHIFIWEKSYIARIEDFGFENVYYLPLATDPEVFKRTSPSSVELNKYRCSISFVGNSMVDAVREWFRRFPNSEITDKLGRIALQMQKKCHSTPIERILRQIEEKHGLSVPFEDRRHRLNFESALVLKATQEYRKELLEELRPFKIRIYGDRGWMVLLDGADNIALFPRLNYYTQLPLLYNGSTVNLNATSFQMNSAVNQRVFDVAACEAFLLTDHQADMDELFEVGKEAVCYHSKEELRDLVGYYLRHQGEREKIARRARLRVVKQHTYVHRMQKIISLLRRRYREV